MANGFAGAKIGNIEPQSVAGNPMYYSQLPDYIQAGMRAPVQPQGEVIEDKSFSPATAMQMQSPAAVMEPTDISKLPYAQKVAYGQAQAVQGGVMPTTTETQVQQRVVDPRYAKQEAAAEVMTAGAMKAQYAAQEEESRIRAIAYDKLSTDMEMKQAEYNKVMDEFKGAKIVDPQSKWGTSAKIGAAISMALGAFAATYSGGRNYAADIIEGAIKRDMDLQEAQIRKYGLDAKQAEGALATAYRRLGDLGQARNAVEMAALANVGDDLMKRAEASDNQKVKANAQMALASLEQKKAQRASAQNEMMIATVGRPISRGATMELETPYGLAPSAQAANEVRRQAQEIEEAKTGLAAFKTIIDKYGSWNLVPSEEKGKYQSALLPVINAYRVSLNLGVLNPSERGQIESELKNKVSQKEAGAFIKGMESMIGSRETALQKAYIVGGGRPSQVEKTKAQLGFSK